MCLGFPGQIVSISGMVAEIDCWGTRKRVSLLRFDETVSIGDYVIEHDGAAVRRIPADEVADTLALYETILAETLVPV